MMYGMIKTTIYLSEDLKFRVEQTARAERRSQAEIIRTAIDQYTISPRPTLPLFSTIGPTDLAENDERYLVCFGED